MFMQHLHDAKVPPISIGRLAQVYQFLAKTFLLNEVNLIIGKVESDYKVFNCNQEGSKKRKRVEKLSVLSEDRITQIKEATHAPYIVAHINKYVLLTFTKVFLKKNKLFAAKVLLINPELRNQCSKKLKSTVFDIDQPEIFFNSFKCVFEKLQKKMNPKLLDRTNFPIIIHLTENQRRSKEAVNAIRNIMKTTQDVTLCKNVNFLLKNIDSNDIELIIAILEKHQPKNWSECSFAHSEHPEIAVFNPHNKDDKESYFKLWKNALKIKVEKKDLKAIEYLLKDYKPYTLDQESANCIHEFFKTFTQTNSGPDLNTAIRIYKVILENFSVYKYNLFKLITEGITRQHDERRNSWWRSSDEEHSKLMDLLTNNHFI